MATTAILPKGRTACSRGRSAQAKKRNRNNNERSRLFKISR